MSMVTSFILVAKGTPGDEAIDHINAWLATEEDHPSGFERVDESAGGYKVMECRVYLFAGNYVSIDQMVAACEQAPWESGSWVQLLAMPESDDWMREVWRWDR